MNTPRTGDLHALLEATAVFGHLKRDQIEALLEQMAWFWLPGGGLLYRNGEEPDALYLLKSGSLGVFGADRPGAPQRLLGLVSAGMTVGELGLISGEARNNTVRALRDSELLRLSREGFDHLVARHPSAMLGAARIAVQRLLQRTGEEATSTPRTFAILPFDRGIDAHAFATALQRHLQAWGDCALIDARLGHGRDTDWFAACEAGSRFVLYVDDGDASWQRLCRRQADAMLLLAKAEQAPVPWPDASDGATSAGPDTAALSACEPDSAQHRPLHLVLWHPPGKFIYGAARAWRAQLGNGGLRHHHWRRDDDVARIARLLSGNGTGLALSGGGARGFAQIGVVQALRESGIAIDAVAGTSIGAIIGAGVAYEWDDAKMREAYRRAMVDGKPLGDWTLPLVALTRGARTTMLLREAFGEIDIEDLPIRFACVSSDLTLAATSVHREGLLWRWLRASSAVPGILPPLLHGGHVYVDGGLLNNLPTDILAEEGHGRIIAVDIGTDYSLHTSVDEAASPPWPTLWRERRHSKRRPGLLSILMQAGVVNPEVGSARRRALADLLLCPDMQRIGLFDWHEFDRAIGMGYRYTRDALRSQPQPLDRHQDRG